MTLLCEFLSVHVILNKEINNKHYLNDGIEGG